MRKMKIDIKDARKWNKWVRLAKNEEEVKSILDDKDFKALPAKVKKAVIYALTTAAIIAEITKQKKPNVPLAACLKYDYCRGCKHHVKTEDDCDIVGSTKKSLKKAMVVYAEAYDAMPGEYKAA